MKTIRARNLPRIQISSDLPLNFPKVSWKGNNNESLPLSEITELGLNSIVGTLLGNRTSDAGTISFDDLSVPATFVRMKNGNPIFRLDITTTELFGQYFELYRMVAFPNLRPRNSQELSDIFSLYIKTKYLKQFVGDGALANLEPDLTAVWKNVSNIQHKYSADYITVDVDEKLCGASSIVQGFCSKTEAIWVFHQLCSVTSPALLDCSGQLYAWRAEYLFARPEPLKVIGWFRSESRWLERIYVKFASITKGKSSIRPVTWIRGNVNRAIENSETASAPEVTSLMFGELKRSCTYKDPVEFGASGPDYLNACAALNGAFRLSDDPNDATAFDATTQALLRDQGRETMAIHLTLAPGASIPPGFEKHPSDRFFIIEKEDLGDFLACVDHSIALTRRKLAG